MATFFLNKIIYNTYVFIPHTSYILSSCQDTFPWGVLTYSVM